MMTNDPMFDTLGLGDGSARRLQPSRAEVEPDPVAVEGVEAGVPSIAPEVPLALSDVPVEPPDVPAASLEVTTEPSDISIQPPDVPAASLEVTTEPSDISIQPPDVPAEVPDVAAQVPDVALPVPEMIGSPDVAVEPPESMTALPDVAALPVVETEAEVPPIAPEVPVALSAVAGEAPDVPAPSLEVTTEPSDVSAGSPEVTAVLPEATALLPTAETEADEITGKIGVPRAAAMEAPSGGELGAPAVDPSFALLPLAQPAARPGRKRRQRDIALLLLAIILMVTGGVVVFASIKHAADTKTYPDLNGQAVVPDDPSMNDPGFVASADASPNIGLQFAIPSVNLDVPLGEVNMVNNVINPPGFTSAYWVRNLGVSLANAPKGTVYVATHSLRPPGVAPGNSVIDVASGQIVVANGSEIDVGDRVYTVVSSKTYLKDQLGNDASLWTATPNRLVFITCMQFQTSASYLANGHSSTNVVIIGQLVK